MILSLLGQQGFARILPENSEPIFRITLGHFAEGQSFHYILNGTNRAEESMTELGSADEEVRCDSSNNQNEIELNYLVDENNHEIDPHENNENSNEIDPSEKYEENYNYLETLASEILEKIFFLALSQSDNSFLNHVCWTFQNSIAAIPKL